MTIRVGADYRAGVDRVAVSKRLSFVLRHRPDSIGLSLSESGWVAVDALLEALSSHGLVLSRAELDEVVRSNDKQRFAFDETGDLIRASQGHSVKVSLDHEVLTPPGVLFHGTPTRNVASIRQDGLQRRGRHAVHLSSDRQAAAVVGRRRGEYTILRIDAAGMTRAGHTFTRSPNGVWLTEFVPASFIAIDDDGSPS